MKERTAKIIKAFIDEMEADRVGWNLEVIGSEAYHLYRILENPENIPRDGK